MPLQNSQPRPPGAGVSLFFKYNFRPPRPLHHAHRLSVTSYVLSALHVLSPIFFQIFAKCKFSYLVIYHKRSGQDSGVLFICLLQPATCKPNRTISINVDYLLYISYLLIIFPFGKGKGTTSYLVHVHQKRDTCLQVPLI